MNEILLALIKNSYGFDPAESRHHFVVEIPRGGDAPIKISEHLTWDDETGSSPVSSGATQDGQIRVILARIKWDAIADETRTQFNLRLKRMGRKSGAWRVGPNLVRRELGKELMLLAWAIEEADPALIQTAIVNWNGLVPEERWWLYTQTAAATGHGINDRGRGWQSRAHALTENPVLGNADAMLPEYFQRASSVPTGVCLANPAKTKKQNLRREPKTMTEPTQQQSSLNQPLSSSLVLLKLNSRWQNLRGKL